MRLNPTPLVHSTDPTKSLDSSSISLDTQPLALTDGVPRSVGVTIANVKHAGVYKGALRFLAPGQAATDALVIDVTLNVRARPDVRAVPDTLTFQAVHCGLWCSLQHVVSSAADQSFPVSLENQSEGAFTLTGAAARLRSAKTGQFLAGQHVASEAGDEDSEVQTATLALDARQAQAGQYAGVLRFDVKDVTAPVNVNTTVNVRDDPALVLVVLLLGLCIGRLLRSKSYRLMGQYRRMQSYAGTVQDHEAREQLKDQLSAIRDRIEAGVEPEAALKAEIDKVQARVNLLKDLDYSVKRLSPLSDEQKQLVAQARRAALADDAEAFKAATAKLLDSHKPAGALASLSGTVARAAVDQGGSAGSVGQRVAAFLGRAWRWLRHVFVGILGLVSGQVTEGGHRVLEPLIGTVVLLTLLAMGLVLVYDKDPAFGQNGLRDYTALLFWAISSEVVQRTLLEQNLPAA